MAYTSDVDATATIVQCNTTNMMNCAYLNLDQQVQADNGVQDASSVALFNNFTLQLDDVNQSVSCWPMSQLMSLVTLSHYDTIGDDNYISIPVANNTLSMLLW
jgi:hypothetical protein